MLRTRTKESIEFLKEKFEEIKRNLNEIEYKQSEYFHQSLIAEKTHKKSMKTKHRRSNSSGIINVIKNSERSETQILVDQINRLKKENSSLKSQYYSIAKKYEEQSKYLSSVLKENEELRNRASMFEPSKKPSVGCKTQKHLPMKHEVSFSQDLFQILPIDKVDTLNRLENNYDYSKKHFFLWNREEKPLQVKIPESAEMASSKEKFINKYIMKDYKQPLNKNSLRRYRLSQDSVLNK